MKQRELEYVSEAFEWNSDTTFTLMHSGENLTYVVETENTKYAVRRYRPGRYTLEQVRAEIAWVNKLGEFIHVPGILKNKTGDCVTRVVTCKEEKLYAVCEFIDGNTTLQPAESNYHNLGRLLRRVHDSADDITKKVTVDWEGWNRPQYDLRHTVDGPLHRLLEFAALTNEDKKRCVTIAEELTHQFVDRVPDSTQYFIHADLHFGNIVATPDKWYCLDFDECGFGPRAIDIGVIRLHLQSLKPEEREKYWISFKAGYGRAISEKEAHLGTALRVFYMTGKIPMRQDIEQLRHKPEHRIRRYLEWVESEINSVL